MQIARLSKYGLFALFFRGYGTQRCHNYYEILEVSPNCSQKEIRNAFIALSKKFHPDIIGQKGHDKFVMVQEAYNVLSKEHSRRQYDMNLKYNTHPSFSSKSNQRPDSHPYRVYRSRREWEEEMARGNWKPDQKGQTLKYNQFLIYIIFGIVCIFFQLIFVYQGLSRANLFRTKYQREYNEMRENFKGLTRKEQIDLIEKMRLAKEVQNKRKYNDD